MEEVTDDNFKQDLMRLSAAINQEFDRITEEEELIGLNVSRVHLPFRTAIGPHWLMWFLLITLWGGLVC